MRDCRAPLGGRCTLEGMLGPETARRSVHEGVLVVGGGFLGTHVTAGFATAGVPTTLLRRAAPVVAAPSDGIAGVRIIHGDATDPEVVDDALTGCRHVVWCAGGMLPDDSNADPIGDVLSSLPALLTCLEAVRRRVGIGMTLLSSGGAVYGNPAVLPVPETHPLNPRTSYAVMKIAAEHYLALYRQVYGVTSVVLRCGNVFGEGQRGDRSQGLVAAVMAHLHAGTAVPVFGDGSAVRDYLYVDDLVSVVVATTEHPDLPGVLNVGSGQGTSITDILSLIEDVTGLVVRVDRRPERPGDVRSVVLDIARLRSVLAFDPLPIREGLVRTWAARGAEVPPP
jgi:UDP-glucose 4-epimerase